MKFPTSHKKIQRARKHITDIHELGLAFGRHPDCYAAWIDNHAESGQNFFCIDIREDLFPADEIALTAGDALHNLRSALDLMFYQVALKCSGIPTRWNTFPIRDTREALIDHWLNSALKQRQVTAELGAFIVDTIKPYKTGNHSIWALHQMNISDKHEFFVPALKFVAIVNVSLEDDKGRAVGRTGYAMNESCRIRLEDADGRKVTIKNKGHATLAVMFGPDTLFENQPIPMTLAGISEEITRTIEAFEMFLQDRHTSIEA
jgi:hypothetical protein